MCMTAPPSALGLTNFGFGWRQEAFLGPLLYESRVASPDFHQSLFQVQNYYVQRFSGYRWWGKGPTWPNERVETDPTAPDWSRLYKRALEVLLQFDVVGETWGCF